MSSALCGFPYNPGDDPKKFDLMSSAYGRAGLSTAAPPGVQATMQPAEAPTSVLNFFIRWMCTVPGLVHLRKSGRR